MSDRESWDGGSVATAVVAFGVLFASLAVIIGGVALGVGGTRHTAPYSPAGAVAKTAVKTMATPKLSVSVSGAPVVGGEFHVTGSVTDSMPGEVLTLTLPGGLTLLPDTP